VGGQARDSGENRGQLPLNAAVRYAFSGHQTFPFRYAWLPKGVGAIRRDSQVFTRPDALVRLGVGKNMVASIRFWCEALGLIENSGPNSTLTPLGALLFGSSRGGFSSGADPYLEDPGTLWLLHWQLTATPYPASTWHLAFTCWSQNLFTRDELARWLLRSAQESSAPRTSASSIRRDVEVFLRTYVPARDNRRRPLEDSFDCPLAELGLIRPAGNGRFAFQRGPRPSLPGAVLAATLAAFWNHTAPGQKTLTLERALFDPGSPGAAFKLGDQDMVEALERLPAGCGLRYDETAGLRLLIRTAARTPLSLLKSYYRKAQA